MSFIGTPWLIDWYAPWCPPCRKLMPEVRKASQEFDPEKIQFGTIDCSLHRNLCARQGIDSYPTIILYNNSQVHKFHSVLSAAAITEFVNDMLNPIGKLLNECKKICQNVSTKLKINEKNNKIGEIVTACSHFF